MADVLVKTNLTATTAPTVNDDISRGYSIFSPWVDIAAGQVYFAAGVNAGAAVWREAAAGVSVGGAEGQVLTDDGSGGLVSESGLIFDGTNLGIGVSPSLLLDIAAAAGQQGKIRLIGQGNNNEIQVLGYNNASSNGTDLELFKARGTVALPLAVDDDDNLSVWKSLGYDGTSFREAGEMLIDVDGTVVDNVAVPGRITFRTSDASGTRTERMRIDSLGRVGINTPSASALFHVAGSGGDFTVNDDGQMGLVGVSPEWAFGDTNNFTDPDDRFVISADADSLVYQWQDASNGDQRTTVMTLKSDNGATDVRVGIKTITPEDTLTVRGSISARFNDGGTDRGILLTASLGNNTGIIDTHHSTTGMEFRIGNVEQMRLATNGNFGIGVPAANEKLQVDDAIAISSDAEGSTARLTRRSVRELHTLTLGATSDTTSISIPTGARILGVSMNVDTAVTNDGDNTWKADWITGSTQVITAAGTAAAQNTKVNSMHPIYELAAATAEIQFTPQSGNFTAGIIEIVVYYEELTSLADV